MPKITPLSPTFSVAPALGEADFAHLAELGFRTVINNRPDGEERGQPSSSALAAEAARHGLAYLHIPTRKTDVFTDAVVRPTVEALVGGEGPILAFCKSGLRSAIVWAAATSRQEPVDGILKSLATAGFDVGFIRDDLESQADRARWDDPAAHVADASTATPNAPGRAAA